ncbi:hypothetical protein LWI29_035101 [Acer saccharum]|uniref:Ubiquitin-like protease family profile domain-containing protein n=1 Tax=Acer saccharum TaxID=4024 RepID=A0AA39W9I8_ACESA|nr:hypothetical protein LWI29_035101 [Acer saccharum]
MQAQQNAMQAQMTSMQNSVMDEMRMGFLRLTELICLNKVAEKLNEENTTDFSHDDYIQDYQPLVSHGGKSPVLVVVSETSADVKELTRPPKLTIRVPRDRKRSAFTMSLYIDPTVKRPRKPKLSEFGSDTKVDDEIIRSMQAWISDNKNTCMDTGLLEVKPPWFEWLLSPDGWLDGDIKIHGRWATATKGDKQFKHETYQWDDTMINYVKGKYPKHASEPWRTINNILFPANVNQNHWVAVEVDLNQRVIKVYDSIPDAYSVEQILKWATCLRKMLPSLLVHVLPDTYTDSSSFMVERPEEGVPHQGNSYVYFNFLMVIVCLT